LAADFLMAATGAAVGAAMVGPAAGPPEHPPSANNTSPTASALLLVRSASMATTTIITAPVIRDAPMGSPEGATARVPSAIRPWQRRMSALLRKRPDCCGATNCRFVPLATERTAANCAPIRSPRRQPLYSRRHGQAECVPGSHIQLERHHHWISLADLILCFWVLAEIGTTSLPLGVFVLCKERVPDAATSQSASEDAEAINNWNNC
jgi:hypothetical protein